MTLFVNIYSLKTQCPDYILSCDVTLLHGNFILMSCSERVRSFLAACPKELASAIVCFHNLEQKVEIKSRI